jgi:hypothetical protein
MMPTIEELDRVRLLGFQEAYLGGAEPEQATYASIAAVVAAWTEALAQEAEQNGDAFEFWDGENFVGTYGNDVADWLREQKGQAGE